MTGRARAELALSEADFQRRVIDLAKLRGWKVAHYRPAKGPKGAWSTPVTGHAGAPDLILARDGEVILAELKSETGRLSAEQRQWLDALGDHGYLWRPSDWDEVREVLEVLS